MSLRRDSTQSPAPGLRHRYYGTLYYVGDGGYSWSSSIPAGSSNARHLDFSNSWLHPQGSDGCAYGFQVRCLLE